MKKLYKVIVATVVYAEDRFAAQSYIKDHDKTDAFAFQDVSVIETLEDLPTGWVAGHMPMDTTEPYIDPWADDTIEEILQKSHDEQDSVTLAELKWRYLELKEAYTKLENRILTIEEEL